MTPVTFDTSVIIAYKVQSVPEHYLWSAVVLAELTSGAADNSIRKAHEATRQAAVQEETLIVPTAEDWLLASAYCFGSPRAARRELEAKFIL